MISVPHKQIINPERRMRKKVRADIKEQIRRLIKRSPTNKDRRAEQKHEAESRVVVRTSNTNSTSACLVRKKCVWSRPPSHPTLAAPREPQNTVTRNSFLRALFHLIFFFPNIREMKNRLLAKPLRGAAAAASGLWQEGD